MKRTVDEIQRGLRALTAPEPPPHLLPKILESRATGIRVALPHVSRDRTRWIVGAVAAGVALAVVMSSRIRERSPVASDTGYEDIAAALSLWPRAALAQQTGPPRAPRYDLVRHVDASRVQAGTWTYDMCATIDEVLTKCHNRLTITVREAVRAEQPAWLMIQKLVGQTPTGDTFYVPPDTTYFVRQTLRPIEWSMTGERIHAARHFAHDSLREAVDITGPHPRSWRARAKLPTAEDAPLVLRWARYDVAMLLQALPLVRGWQGSVYSVGLIGRVPGASPFPPLDFRVLGSDRIDVPAGRFNCWKIEMRTGDETPLTLWASKDRGWLIKTRGGGRDFLTESTLISATPPAP
ncbi:MAG TPA: hypothetical protein VGV12_11465 [Gemmatimonadales bacterium]|nr:hypothetical protein [Gemmatimonadales bacterium]